MMVESLFLSKGYYDVYISVTGLTRTYNLLLIYDFYFTLLLSLILQFHFANKLVWTNRLIKHDKELQN